MIKATDVLREQHRALGALFERLRHVSDAQARTDLADQITRELQAHMAVEEQLFYPAMREVPDEIIPAMVSEAYEEHEVLKLILGRLSEMAPDRERFEAEVKVLREAVEHHVREEESVMFRAAEKLGAARLEELGEQIAARAMPVQPTELDLENDDKYDEILDGPDQGIVAHHPASDRPLRKTQP
ncbi:MAG: hemerythrin domain-containing protein [Candidatus Binatia bacterium]